MVYRKLPGDERSRNRLFIEATDDNEAWAKANADCKRLGAPSIIADLPRRPFCIGPSALTNATNPVRLDERTRSNKIQSALAALFLGILATIGSLELVPALAQQAVSDDVQKGHYLSALMCSNCHVVSSDQSIEPALQPPAPSFESIAQRSSTSSEALSTFLTTTHRNIGNSAGMPNPALRDFQMRQVEAYVLSLRMPSGTAPISRKPPTTRPELCRAEIARVELLMSKARTSGQGVGSAPDSSAARLHRQPTLKSVEQAMSEAETNVETALAFARELAAEGLYAECAAMLQHIQPPSGSPD